jgi:DNA-binding beta-propeller fold protein YncE
MNITRWIAAAVLVVGGGCGGGDALSGGDDDRWYTDAGIIPACFSSSECPPGWTCGEVGFCVPPPGPDGGAPPPEIEYELGAPVSSRRYVWVAMPDQDAIARIDGATLEVHSVPVGDRPEVLVALPGTDTAIVLDRHHGAATVIRPTTTGDQIDVAPTLSDLNQMAASPSGRHAVAYFDLARALAESGGVDPGVGSLQDVTVVDLRPGSVRTVDLTVGPRPREVEFDTAGTRAFVITRRGISVIDLDGVAERGPSIIPPIPITPDPFADASSFEVDVTPAGDLAVVREVGGAWLRVVSLSGPTTGQLWEIALPGVPSDLEMAPDGRRAYAVLREQAALAVIDLPDDVVDPAGIELIDLPSATLGSMTLTGDGRRAVLYTNAILDERLTVIELDAPGFPYRTFPLEKSVRAVGIDPTGDKLLVLHARAFGDPEDATTVDEYIDRSWGYSLVDVATGFAKLQLTPVDPGPFTFAAGAPRAYLCLDGGDAEGAIAALQVIELDTGVVRQHRLGSPPDAVGVIPDSAKVFVSQRHPLGRVSFVDTVTGAIRTVTGFDLNGQVID